MPYFIFHALMKRRQRKELRRLAELTGAWDEHVIPERKLTHEAVQGMAYAGVRSMDQLAEFYSRGSDDSPHRERARQSCMIRRQLIEEEFPETKKHCCRERPPRTVTFEY